MPLTPSAMNGGRSSGPLSRHTSLLAVFSLTALMAGCAMPAHMRIENAYHPKYEDKDVRFRATYYFRVFDYCTDQGVAKQQPRSDTLYRFRMTGKASALTNKIHFESGTLTAGQIDPFGANVAYDERNNQFYFKSQTDTQQEAAHERKLQDLDRLMVAYNKLKDELLSPPGISPSPETVSTPDVAASAPTATVARTPGAAAGRAVAPARTGARAAAPASAPTVTAAAASAPGTPATTPVRKEKNPRNTLTIDEAALLANFREVIQQRISSLKDLEFNLATVKIEDTNNRPGNGAGAAGNTNVTPAAVGTNQQQVPQRCLETRRGFQILGPEGWRTFKQDERLLLALSTSGKPLISTMQELSGRVLDNQPIEAELLLPLVQEDLRISLAGRELEKFTGTNPERGKELLDNAIKNLKSKGSTK